MSTPPTTPEQPAGNPFDATSGPPSDVPFEVPEVSLLDDGSIRRAVRRGVLLTGLVAAAWLLLATVVLYIGAVVVAALHTEHFHDLAYYGAQVGRPGYVVDGNGCCAGSFGLTNVQALDFRQRGALGLGGQVDGQVRRGQLGRLAATLPAEDATPVGAALARPRPTKAGTSAFLQTLPPLVSVSAIVEFSTPLDEAGLDRVNLGDNPALTSERALLLTDPYGGQVVSWPDHSPTTFTDWVATLTEDDADKLDELAAAPLAVLRTAARSPRIHAVVVQQATIDDLRALLRDPQVRSVNVAEVAFDPARQNPTN